jgi:hypothetical protein
VVRDRQHFKLKRKNKWQTIKFERSKSRSVASEKKLSQITRINIGDFEFETRSLTSVRRIPKYLSKNGKYLHRYQNGKDTFRN